MLWRAEFSCLYSRICFRIVQLGGFIILDCKFGLSFLPVVTPFFLFEELCLGFFGVYYLLIELSIFSIRAELSLILK
jgi:hypothetical protein